MNRFLLIIVLSLSAVSTHAQYVRVNYDQKTIAAMAGAFAAEAVTEAYYSEQVNKILEKYSAAEVAAAGIFASKYLDRQALTDLGIWSSSTENYYYRHIYKLVSTKIMPKIWTVAGQMLHSPQNALYWGSYLMKICAETKALCMQFESVVTNSRLGFSDLTFLELRSDVAKLFTLSELGGMNWKSFFNSLGNINNDFTKENLTADLDKLYSLGVGLANAGADNVLNQLLANSSFNSTFTRQANSVARVVNNTYQLINSLDKSVGNTLLSLIGGKAAVSKLFTASDYNVSEWMTDYVRETVGQYYTQEWSIIRNDDNKEVVCDYAPPFDGTSVASGDEWTLFATSDASFTPTAAQYQQILSKSEACAGWSRDKVSQLNAANTGYTYNISYMCTEVTLSKGSKQTYKAYAYKIYVTKTWTAKQDIYSTVFDSYSMDMNAFMMPLMALVDEYNANEEGAVYTITCGEKRYYNTTDAAKMAGCESVVISVTCSDGATLMESNTQYKCNTCTGTLSDHTKQCSLLTSVSDSDLDQSAFDKKDAEYAQQITDNNTKISNLEAENQTLIQLWASNGGYDNRKEIEAQIKSNEAEIANIQAENETLQQLREQLAQAKAEAGDDSDEETDDYYRIPSIMRDCQSAYNLTWSSNGYWNGYTYIREATAPNIKGTLKFEATLSVVRKPQYVLGVKIHRAIIGIKWKLSADYSDTQVIDVLTFDGTTGDTEKAQEVNKRLSEIAQDYPDCELTTEYLKEDAAASDATTDTTHLLWSSDRLEVARQVDTRLTQIYADLISLEKMMNYKLTIVDILNAVAPLSPQTATHSTIPGEAYTRWLNIAKTQH